MTPRKKASGGKESCSLIHNRRASDKARSIAMRKIVVAVLVLAIAALANVAQAAETAPSAFKSLQPFERFAKGAGEGVAYEYKARTKAQFVTLLRDKKLAQKEMRVTCDVLVRQMVEAHPGLPFEGCEGAAAAIEHDDSFAVVPCRDEMFQKEHWLAVTNEDGSAWGVWHRKCLKNEQVLVYKNQTLISLRCLNVAIAIPSVPIPPAVLVPPSKPIIPIVTGACPNGYTLVANAWELKSLPDGIRKNAERLIAAAESRDSRNATNAEAYKPDDVSRTLGGQLRREVKIRAPLNADIRVQLRDPQTLKVVEELGTLHLVDGIGSIQLTYEQHLLLVEMLWPGRFRSPVVSGAARRLWLFPYEWKDWCEMNVHGIVP